tara:strand:+ start:324 stop:569 length:246 start_codon:yes stop_codon:yes gene_type:complete
MKKTLIVTAVTVMMVLICYINVSASELLNNTTICKAPPEITYTTTIEHIYADNPRQYMFSIITVKTLNGNTKRIKFYTEER